jgi:hypothetical protein
MVGSKPELRIWRSFTKILIVGSKPDSKNLDQLKNLSLAKDLAFIAVASGMNKKTFLTDSRPAGWRKTRTP